MAFLRSAAIVASLSVSGLAEGAPCGDASAPERARAALAQMTQSEKLSLVHGVLGAPWGGRPKPAGALGSAGYVPGVPRLGVPALQETDAELGVANGRPATAMPSNLALASTWDLGLARRQGAAVGAEARVEGFNVLLGGAANLIRDPRGGRNFEYFSEDPLVTGLMAGAAIDGAQSRHLIATAKHFALNDQETDRVVLDVRIDPGAARESDLFAFEIAIERGGPGAVMCAYNQVNGVYSCENDWLLNQVLKGDWRYPGFVMSDWGAVHSTVRSALAGLDQESGEQLDTQNFFERLGKRGRRRRRPAGAARRHGAANSDVDLRLRSCRWAGRLGSRRPRLQRRDGAGRRTGRGGALAQRRPVAAPAGDRERSLWSAPTPTAACRPGEGHRRWLPAAGSRSKSRRGETGR